MRKYFSVFCLGLALSSPTVLAAAQATPAASHQLFQVATLYALESGIFEGDFPYQRLMPKGALGIGTFNAIDGEMVAIDGKYYQGTPECRLRPVTGDLIAPFAEVIPFNPTVTATLNNLDNYSAIGKRLLQQFPNQNMPYAIRINGVFNEVTVRNLTKQTPPYPNLLAASKTQGVLKLKNVKGTAVGFWFPHYWEGIGMPGFHLHFATDDRQFGGHVLALSVQTAQVQLEPIQSIQVYLPNIPAFTQAHMPDPDTIEKDLLQVEGEK